MVEAGKSVLYNKSAPWQKIAGYLSIILAIIGVCLVTKLMNDSRTEKGYLGGLNWKDLIFNYHPIFMTSGLILCSISAILTYRLLPLPKTITKPLHAAIHTLAIILVVIGLTCVIVGNNYKDYNTGNAFYTNLTSLHSFLGLSAVLLFFQNYVLGIVHFLTPLSWVPAEDRKYYLPLHVFLGTFSLMAAAFAVQTGLMELLAESGVCYYDLTSADTNPAANYHLLPEGCRVGNGAGVCVLVAVLLFYAAVYDFSSPVRSDPFEATEEHLLKSSSAPHQHFSYNT